MTTLSFLFHPRQNLETIHRIHTEMRNECGVFAPLSTDRARKQTSWTLFHSIFYSLPYLYSTFLCQTQSLSCVVESIFFFTRTDVAWEFLLTVIDLEGLVLSTPVVRCCVIRVSISAAVHRRAIPLYSSFKYILQDIIFRVNFRLSGVVPQFLIVRSFCPTV